MRVPAFALLPFAALAIGAASAQERSGRYVMSPTENGFVRLDTETGAMSVCARGQDGQVGKWTCEPMGDEARALRDEVARLRAENERLQAQVRGAGPGTGDQRAERPDRKLELPSEQDVDKALDYVERIFKKFRDRLRQFEDSDKKGGSLERQRIDDRHPDAPPRRVLGLVGRGGELGPGFTGQALAFRA